MDQNPDLQKLIDALDGSIRQGSGPLNAVGRFAGGVLLISFVITLIMVITALIAQ